MDVRAIATMSVFGALLAAAPAARADEVSHELWVANTPPRIVEAGTRAGLWTDYRLRNAPTPYLRGDLDGDGRIDDIVLVARRSDDATSLVVLWGKRGRKPAWLALHEPPSGDGGYWYVAPRRGKARGEVVVMTDPDAHRVWWNGRTLKVQAIERDPSTDSGEGRVFE